MWKRWNWLGHYYSGGRSWATVLGHWGENQKVECREEDQRALGQGLLREREKRQGGGAGVWPRRKQVMGGGWGGQFDAFMLIITMTSLRCFAELRYLSYFRFLTYSKCFTSVASLRCFKYLKDLTWGAALTECALLSWDPSPSWAALVTWDASITRGT